MSDARAVQRAIEADVRKQRPAYQWCRNMVEAHTAEAQRSVEASSPGAWAAMIGKERRDAVTAELVRRIVPLARAAG